MKTIHTLLMVCIAIAMQAQSIDHSVISNAGGVASSTSYIIAFTIGETFTENISNSETIEQGFWSGILAQNILSTEDYQLDASGIVIYPNPATDFFMIHIPTISRYDVTLFNSKGQKVVSRKINTSLERDRIDISSLSQGIYMLSISIPETGENKTFKIIKN